MVVTRADAEAEAEIFPRTEMSAMHDLQVSVGQSWMPNPRASSQRDPFASTSASVDR